MKNLIIVILLMVSFYSVGQETKIDGSEFKLEKSGQNEVNDSPSPYETLMIRGDRQDQEHILLYLDFQRPMKNLPRLSRTLTEPVTIELKGIPSEYENEERMEFLLELNQFRE